MTPEVRNQIGMLTVRLLEIAKNNGYSSYAYGKDNKNNITTTTTYSEADRLRQSRDKHKDRIVREAIVRAQRDKNFLGRQREKNYEYRVDARIDISDCWCVT